MRVLLLLRGAPGCGKSTWIRERGLEDYALSADKIRLMCSSPSLNVHGSYEIDQTRDKQVWKTLFSILETRMEAGEFTVIDATNSKTVEMNRYKELCQSYRYRIYCVDMTDIPIEEVKRRNRNREPLKRVPEEVIDRMYSRFSTQKIPSGITVIKPDELNRIMYRKIDLSDYDAINFIGDIHGCYTALQDGLKKANWPCLNEYYIFLGDYIDRGVENAEVLGMLMSLAAQPNVLLLEGNHERSLWNWANGQRSNLKEFELFTRPAIEKFDPKNVRKFYRKLAQCTWFDYNGKEFFACHAGISTMPENLTKLAAIQMIKGVGGYNDIQHVESMWDSSTEPYQYQVHGHRNLQRNGIAASERTFNLEGGVEFGRELRILRIEKDGGVFPISVVNTVYKEFDEADQTEDAENVADLIMNLRADKHIVEKQYGNISSFNFSRSAFEHHVWNHITTKARGLYINIPRQKIVARSYTKFFNVNERPETRMESLSRSLSFPVTAYVKENGFLGMAAHNPEDGSLFITSKSSPSGDYAELLRENMRKVFTQEQLDMMNEYSRKNNVTFVFECVDPVNDPHIIDYPELRIYLLDIVYNELSFRKMPYDDMVTVANEIGLRRKELAYIIESWPDFCTWYAEVIDPEYKYHGNDIEGFVIEDADGNMVKLKLTYYNFWKFMRSVAHETLRRGYIQPQKTSALATPLANEFYGWLRSQHDMGSVEELPRDICALRKAFYGSRQRDNAGGV